jgi:hypothetical protein
MSKNLLVYVAGPYSKGDIDQNVANAIKVGDAIVDMGHTPYIPHLSHYWHKQCPRPYEFWLEYDVVWMYKCDVLVRMSGDSSGADKEVALFRASGKPTIDLQVEPTNGTFSEKALSDAIEDVVKWYFVTGGATGSVAGGESDPTGKAAHEPGSKLDAGKAPIVSGVLQYFPRAIKAVAEVSAHGMEKYTWMGWKTVEDGIRRYNDAEGRHIIDEAIHGTVDTKSGLLHTAHRAWNALAILELVLCEKEKASGKA